jgi:uncharacterized membrane protein YccF (DUF307 family)
MSPEDAINQERSREVDNIMAILGNVLWWVFSFYVPLFYLIGGLVLFPLLPWLWPLIRYSLTPFGKTIISKRDIVRYQSLTAQNGGAQVSSIIPEDLPARLKLLGNIVWVFTFGILLAFMHIVAALLHILFFWTIVAIPGITAHIKMIPVAFAPFDKVVISGGVAKEIKQALEKQHLGI